MSTLNYDFRAEWPRAGGYPFGHSAKPWKPPPAGEVVASSQCVRGADPRSPRSCPGPCCQSLASVAVSNGRCRRNGTLAPFGVRPRLLQHPPRPQSHAAVCVPLRRSALRAKHVLGYSTHALAGPVFVERYENLPIPVLHRPVFLQRSISTDPHDRGWLPALDCRAYPGSQRHRFEMPSADTLERIGLAGRARARRLSAQALNDALVDKI